MALAKLILVATWSPNPGADRPYRSMTEREPPQRTSGPGRACASPRAASAETQAGSEAPAARRLAAAAKRFGPLLAIAAAMLLAIGMGWHREVTLENIALLRERFHHVLTAHKALSLVVYCLIYILAV